MRALWIPLCWSISIISPTLTTPSPRFLGIFARSSGETLFFIEGAGAPCASYAKLLLKT